MATPAVCSPLFPETFPVLGISTKGLHCDDSFARLIGPDFVDLVDPRKLVMYLPHDLLTPSDEDRVVARQDSHGREEAARLLLALLSRRGDWVPRLQRGLRHREIRLNHLAQKIDTLQCEVPMEIDFPEGAANDMLMEVDSEPWTHATESEAHSRRPREAPPATQPQGTEELSPQSPSDQTGPVAELRFQTPPTLSASGQAPAAQTDPAGPQAVQMGLPGQPQRPVPGSCSGEALDPRRGQGVDTQTVLNNIAHVFFTRIAQSPQDVKLLTDCLERIVVVLTTTYAVGCLEMRLRLTSSRDVRQLRRLVESGVLQDTVERAVLNDERRDWLRKEAALHGFSWRWIKLAVTIKSEDLDRCETFLRVREEFANPRNAAEALLQKSMALARTPKHVHHLPDLLLSFLEWLLHHRPDWAQGVAFALLASSPCTDILKIFPMFRSHFENIFGIMEVCRSHFKLSIDLELGLGRIAFHMMEKFAKEGAALEETPVKVAHDRGERPSLYLEAPPGSTLAEDVHRLRNARLMVPHEMPSTEHAFRFVDEFVTDFALGRVPFFLGTLPGDYVSRVVQIGSPFVVLHLVDLLLFGSYDHGGSRFVSYTKFKVAHILLPDSADCNSALFSQLQCTLLDSAHPPALTEFLCLACQALPGHTGKRAFLQSCWWTFGRELKHHLRAILGSGDEGDLPDILLYSVSAGEMNALRDTGRELLAATHTMDLTEKLNDLSEPQLRVILACAQLTNVADFNLVKIGGVAALKVKQEEQVKRVAPSSVGQPALKLCKNHLEEKHVRCLLDALPGLESVSHFDLSSCAITRHNLQRLLDHLCMTSVKGLVLNGISFTDARGPTLVRFSHLKKLQSVELSSFGLQDSHMRQLMQQIRELHDLRELALEWNPITTNGLSQLTPALAGCASLRVLRLGGCQLDAGGAYVLGDLLTSAVALNVLKLGHCPLLDSGLQYLSLVLRSHPLLTKLSLREGGYSAAGLHSFFSGLKECPRMQHLELGRCPLQEEGIDASSQVVKALAGSCQWDFLGLWQCRVGHTTLLQQLGTLSNQLHGLASLVLQDNDIDDTQVGHLADAVRRGVFRHLRQLNLRQNNIGEKGAKQLADALCFLPHLSELLLQHSSISVDGAVSLAMSVLHLPHMTLLDLSDSYCMGRYEAIEAVNRIEGTVMEEGIVIGVGVGYAENDASLEEQFIADRFELLGVGITKSAQDQGASAAERQRQVALPSPVQEKIHDSGKLSSPSPEEPVGEEAQARRRGIPTKVGNTLFFDDMLRIVLGHQ